jgi:CDP-glycerol:poly(glycerophosphate) glycerophosphotransferase
MKGLNFFSRPRNKKKFAFLVHDPVMLVHYADVWKMMDPSNFTILLTENFSSDQLGNEKLGVTDFFNHTQVEGYEVREITEIIYRKIKFEYVVTNHFISNGIKVARPGTVANYLSKLLNLGLLLFGVRTPTYLPQQVGNKQIRYMYGADISDGWSLQSWNDIYDIFLCHGVNDEREIKKRFKGKTFIMGYPRYDRFFSGEIDLSNIKREFGLSGSKKTVLWMPTLGGDYSSIPLFAEPLSMINKKYNLIVRPHPFSFVQEKDFICLLEKFNFSIDRNVLRDMNELFGVADVILADNGGSPFSAIFLGKNVVFLDVHDDIDAESTTTSIFAKSSVSELKKHLPIINNQETQKLVSMLDSEEFYQENSACIETLFSKYFDSPRGGGGKRVADILKNL